MSGFGTDVVALTCILCGAAAGGAATLALMDVQDEVGLRCAVATVEASPRVVVAVGGEEGAIIVRPRVRIHTSHDCASVQIHEQLVISQAIELEEQIHLSMEMVEEGMQRVQVHIEKMELEQLEVMEREMERLQERLEKTGGEI